MAIKKDRCRPDLSAGSLHVLSHGFHLGISIQQQPDKHIDTTVRQPTFATKPTLISSCPHTNNPKDKKAIGPTLTLSEVSICDPLHIPTPRLQTDRAILKIDYDIDGGHVSLQAVHVVETAKRYAAAYGDTEDVLMREAAQKYRSTEHRGREFGFYGAIINQLKYPLSEEIIKHMERKERRRHRR